jgi:hypothetical protein
MNNWHRLVIYLIAVMLAGCTAQPVAQQTFVLGDAPLGQRVMLEITLRNARDQNGILRNGTLSVTSLNDGQRSMIHVTTTDAVAPVWLTTVYNNAVFVTENQERRVVDGQCTRDASGFPPVSIRDMLGPLHGFTQQNDTWASRQGGAAWISFDAQAITDMHGILASMTGAGRGKVLLPGGDVITADVTWRYTTEAYPVTVVAPTTRCESQEFDDISFPESFGASTSMGSALLFSVQGTIVSLRDTLMQHWQNNGLMPIIRDQNQQSVTLEVTIHSYIVRAFLVQTSDQRVDITVIRITP